MHAKAKQSPLVYATGGFPYAKAHGYTSHGPTSGGYLNSSLHQIHLEHLATPSEACGEATLDSFIDFAIDWWRLLDSDSKLQFTEYGNEPN